MGFKEFKQNGTSHQHWKKDVNGVRYKVTVDCPKAPFSQTLIKSMASQAGVSVKTLYIYALDKKKKEDPHTKKDA